MNVQTLNDIVDTSFNVSNEVILGDAIAKKELLNCLPIEQEQFEELAVDKKTDFLEGYDDKFPRVRMDVVRNSTKKQNGKLVPAFAEYDVFSKNPECVIVSNTNTNISSKNGLSKFAGFWETAFWNVARFFNKFHENIFIAPVVISMFLGVVSLLISCIMLLSSVKECVWILSHVTVYCATIFVFSFAGAFLNDSHEIEHKFTHKFSGVIPESIRKTIRENKSQFKTIYLVEESYDWNIETNSSIVSKPSPRNVDPLIIGEVRNTHTGEMNYFLLAKFDVTPLENFVATELSA